MTDVNNHQAILEGIRQAADEITKAEEALQPIIDALDEMGGHGSDMLPTRDIDDLRYAVSAGRGSSDVRVLTNIILESKERLRVEADTEGRIKINGEEVKAPDHYFALVYNVETSEIDRVEVSPSGKDRYAEATPPTQAENTAEAIRQIAYAAALDRRVKAPKC